MSTSTPTTAVPVPPLQGKFVTLNDTMSGMLLERTAVIETAIIALIAEAHHCQQGPPGTGKTKLVSTLMKLIADATQFRWTMTRYTVPEELFGAISLKGMENDEFKRNLKGKMVMSDIAFLDEMFKANSAILNALLTIMNEGLFDNGSEVVESRPLIFCGSNELPKDAELAALWDRVTFRLTVQPIQEKRNFRTMLRARAAEGMQAVAIPPILTWAEVGAAQLEARQVLIPDNVNDAFEVLKGKLRKEGITITDRRWSDCVPILKASAWLDGRPAADVDDIGILQHVLWTDLKELTTVKKVVLEMANPLDKEAMDLIGEVESLDSQVTDIINQTDNMDARRRKGIEVNAKLTRVSENLDQLMKKCESSPKRSRMVDQARARLSTTVDRLLAELFGVDK